MSEALVVRYKKVHPAALTPEYHTAGAAAFDFALVEDVVIAPRGMAKARTGLVIQSPEGHFLLIASRSSNPGKKGVDLANSVGIIDRDYSGPDDEIFLILQNLTDTEVRLSAGDRIAQGLVLPNPTVTLEEITSDIKGESRGGFGTTGG